jgi:hypothetical protein
MKSVLGIGRYKWWILIGTITSIIYSLFITFHLGVFSWFAIVILIIGGFLGELLNKPIRLNFIIISFVIGIYQGLILLLFWAVIGVFITQELIEPAPLPEILIIPWTMFLTITVIIPTNLTGSVIANILKRILKKKNI